MDKRTSGFVLALVTTLAVYVLLMAGLLENGASTPADHAAAKVLGVLGGALVITLVFLVGRRIGEGDSRRLPGYVPLEDDRERS